MIENYTHEDKLESLLALLIILDNWEIKRFKEKYEIDLQKETIEEKLNEFENLINIIDQKERTKINKKCDMFINSGVCKDIIKFIKLKHLVNFDLVKPKETVYKIPIKGK